MAAMECIICEASVNANDGVEGHAHLEAFEDFCICAQCLTKDHPG